jgi:GH25 family lysozyme M1 (1,4-beta-N-acetylmuramidase)
MTDAEIQKAIKDAQAQRKHIKALIADSTVALASLADTQRQLHAEIDRKTKALEGAKTAKHRTAIKKLVALLEKDAKGLDKAIKGRKELRDKRRHAFKRIGDRIRRLRKKRRHSGDPVSGIGPDVSVYQGSVSWDAVESKCAFGFCKATEGRTYTDPTWSSARRQAMEASGLACGAYHFARPDLNSAVDEAQHFVAAVKAAGGKFVSFSDWGQGFIGALDFEHVPYSESWAASWGQEFERLTGVKAILYGGGYSLNPVLGALDHFSAVWIAAYASDWHPYFSGSDSSVAIWQYTSSGSIPGVSGGCDVSKTV